MPGQPPPPEPMPLWQKIEIIKWLSRFPALTVMVILRQDIGYRLLNPLPVMCITAAMLVFAGLFGRDGRPEDLFIYTFVMLAFAVFQRIARWRQMQRGVKQHSFYVGTSCFESRLLPAFLRRDRRIARYVDPAFCIVAGVFLLQCSRALGAWLIIAGLCLRLYEDTVFHRELNQRLDTVDGLVVSEIQGEVVEHFEQPPDRNPRQPTSQGVPTGLGGDIEERIREKKARRSP